MTEKTYVDMNDRHGRKFGEKTFLAGCPYCSGEVAKHFVKRVLSKFNDEVVHEWTDVYYSCKGSCHVIFTRIDNLKLAGIMVDKKGNEIKPDDGTFAPR